MFPKQIANSKKQKGYFLLFAICYLIWPRVGFADTGALTWQDCVRLAALKNPQLLSAIRAQEASRAGYYGSYNGIFPHLSLSNSYTDSKESGLAESKEWEAQGTASLDLFDPNQWASIQTSAASFRLAQANQLLASSNVLLNLYKAFATLLYTQEEIGVDKSIRDLWDENAQMISLRYDSGAESKGNSMQTQAQFLQADVAVTQAGRDLLVAQQQLSQAIGQDDFSTLVVTGTWAAAKAPSTPPDFIALVDHLPSVLAQQAVVDQAKASVRAAQSTLYPTLSLNYSRGTEGSSEFPSSPFWTFTGLVSYPLFGGGPTATYYAVSAANKNYAKALQDLHTTRLQAIGTLESAWDGFAQAEDQVRVQRAFLDADIQRKDEADIMYQSGLMTFQDWQLITNDYVNYQKSYLSAEQNLIAAEGQWVFATGQQLGESR
jgi:outer membrane protein TolC